MTITLGADWQRELWPSPYRLRFELNDGGAYVNMFTSSYDRARALARAALPSERVLAVIAGNPDPSEAFGAERRGWTGRTAFEVLDEMGVSTAPWEKAWQGYVSPPEHRDPEMTPWQHRAVSLTWDQCDILLWSQIAHDIGVMPQAPVLAKLVDLQRGVVIYAYDDRGMDITALSPEPIAELYTRFDAWLLDYDRERMAEVFG